MRAHLNFSSISPFFTQKMPDELPRSVFPALSPYSNHLGSQCKYQYVGSTPDPIKSGPIQGVRDLWPIVLHTYGQGTSLWVLSLFPLLNLNVSCDFLFQCDHLCWVYGIGNLAFLADRSSDEEKHIWVAILFLRHDLEDEILDLQSKPVAIMRWNSWRSWVRWSLYCMWEE